VEKISIIRNALGFKFEMPADLKVKFFIDGAWVYEGYLGYHHYQAAIAGTDVYGDYYQTVPTRNYGRVSSGFTGSYKDFDWKVSYTGLYGNRFLDNSASIKFAYKF
jgi:hypothetical protein